MQRLLRALDLVVGGEINERGFRPRPRFVRMNRQARPLDIVHRVLGFIIRPPRRLQIRAMQVSGILHYMRGKTGAHERLCRGRRLLLQQHRLTTGTEGLAAATWAAGGGFRMRAFMRSRTHRNRSVKLPGPSREREYAPAFALLSFVPPRQTAWSKQLGRLQQQPRTDRVNRGLNQWRRRGVSASTTGRLRYA